MVEPGTRGQPSAAAGGGGVDPASTPGERNDAAAPVPLNLAALILAQLGVHAAMTGTRLAVPLEALRADYGAFVAGALLGLFALAPVALALPAGRMADRHGYHRPMRVAVALTAFGALLAAVSSWWPVGWHMAALVIASLACGAGSNASVIATQRTVGRRAVGGVERMRVFSWIGLAPAMGNAVGPVTIGVAIDTLGFGAGYAAMALLALASLPLIARVAREQVLGGSSGSSKKALGLLRLPRLKRLLAVNWLISASWDVHSFAVPVIGHERGFSASTIGLILATFTLAVMGVRLLIPTVAERIEPLRVLRASMVGTGLVMLIYPFMPGAWSMAACALCLGVMLGSVQPMIMTTLLRITPEDRHGQALALRSMAINASSAAMPLAYGALGAVVSAGVLFWVMGAAMGAGQGLVRALRDDKP